jgi:arsenate reductase-like glutaredoxin family protein
MKVKIINAALVLIERPIIFDGYKTTICKPLELVIDLLKRK